MDHTKYHAIRASAVMAFEKGDATALAAIVESSDSLYESIDWSNMSEPENIVFGILTGISLSEPDTKIAVFMKSREADLCIRILGHADAVESLARMVWEQ